MSQSPANSPFEFTPQQIERLNSCERPDQIQPMIESFLLENNQAARTSSGEVELVIPEPAAPAPKTFSEVVEIAGAKGTITADSELELAKKVTAFYKDHVGWKRDAQGRFVNQQQEQQPIPAEELPGDEQEMAVATQDLRMRMVRGEILPEEFLSKKAELEAGLQENKDWGAAVEAFRNSEGGADWVGGEDNQRLMAGMLQHLDLTTGEEVATVEQKTAILLGLWNQMKASGNYYERQQSAEEIAENLADQAIREQQQAEYEKEISACRTASEVADVNTKYGLRPDRDSSSLFGK